MKGTRIKRTFALALALLVSLAALVSAFDIATIATDMPDYYPGDSVIITGSGWEPGETVRLTITQVSPLRDDPTTMFYAIADVAGNVTNSDFRIQEDHLGAAFSLTATGLTSGRTAQTTFTDSPLISTATITVQSPNPVFSGDVANYDFTVNRNAGARNFDVSLTTIGLPVGVTAQFSPSSINFGGGSGGRTVNLRLTVASSVPTGTYSFTAKATVVGNSSDTASAIGTLNVVRDITPPVTTATPSVAPNANGWNNTNVSVQLSATDNVGGSGAKEIVYSASGAQTIGSTTVTGSTANVTLSTNGVTTLSFFARDNAGNVESTMTLIVRIDKIAPTVTQGATSGTLGNSSWYLTDVSVAFTATDATSGLENAADASFSLSTTAEGASVSTGNRIVSDLAGNQSTAGPLTFKVDKTAPVLTQGTASGTAGDNGWYRSNVQVPFGATDATSGLASASDASFSLQANGEGAAVPTDSRTVMDVAGNSVTAGPIQFMIDYTPPALVEGTTSGTPGLNGWYWSAISVGWSANDAISGLRESGDASFAMSTSGEGSGISTGSRTVFDVAGNSSATTAYSFDVDLTDPQVNGVADRAPNSFGWYTVPVTITFEATDGASGIQQVSPAAIYSGPDSDTAAVGGEATDGSGRTSSTSFALKYDATAPTIQVTGIDASCMRIADISASATDLFLASGMATLARAGFAPSQQAMPAAFHVEDEGDYTLHVIAVDQAGNEQTASHSFDIDLTAPVILFGPDWPAEGVYYNVDKTLHYSLLNPDDEFTVHKLLREIIAGNFNVNLPSGYSEGTEGRFTINLTAADCAGNEASVARLFFIDKTPPTVTIDPIGTLGANGWYVGDSLSAQLSAVDPAIRTAFGPLDEIAGSGLASINYAATGATIVGPAAESAAAASVTISEGITNLQLGSTDVAGNSSGITGLMIMYDKTAPSIEPIGDLIVEATGPDGAAVDLPEPDASDNLTTPIVLLSHADGGTFPLGETTVTVSATDEAGNSSQKTFSVTVRDTTSPNFLSSPSDVEVEATGPDGATATFGLPDAQDLVDPAPMVSADHASGELFPLGETTVTVTARDFTGNERTTSFVVRVVDTTPPALSLPDDMEVEGNALGGATVTFLPTALDIVDGDVSVTCAPTTGSLFRLGVTTVACEATDTRGNKATGSFKIKVVDTTPPSFLGVPSDIVAEATGPSGAAVSFTFPTATDIVSGAVSVSSSHPSGAVFPLGTTTVTFSATDGSGNTGLSTFKITVRDTTPPVLTLPANIAQFAVSSAGNAVSFVATSSDIVSGSVPVVCTPASGSVFPLGMTTVSCTATDGAGNVATGSFTVTITYSWSNVLQPINIDGSSRHKLGSTIPVKFRLTGPSAGIADAVARIYVSKIDDNPAGIEVPGDSTSAATTGNLFRYSTDQYIFNLGTKGLSVGRWRIRIDLGDGALHTVEISLK